MARLQTSRAYYADTIADFRAASPDGVLGQLLASSPFAVDVTQRDAWIEEILLLQEALRGVSGGLLLEYEVPRIGSRIDALILTGRLVVPIEFKAGEHRFLDADRNQAWDYGLDLKNFHKSSHDLPIVPILVATRAPATTCGLAPPAPDGVYPPVCCNSEQLPQTLTALLGQVSGTPYDINSWVASPYHPTPTIIEAARALYARHSVSAIAASEAGENLTITSTRIDAIIAEAEQLQRKAVVFVTGVPGAGKTLVGLNVATAHRDPNNPTHSVFLSGNGPLVKVLSHALANDEIARAAREGRKLRKGKVLQEVKAFIQNVHHFRDEGLNESGPPIDHVVIFDEAQRAWNREKTADFMKRKKGRPGFDLSEPEFLMSYLDRHRDWAVVICLVGGGQEINTGEAGISEWLAAVERRFTHWAVHISPQLEDAEYDAGAAVESVRGNGTVHEEPSLHLSVSMRSFRAERVSGFVKALLDLDEKEAGRLLRAMADRYPIVLTRDLARGRQWVREQARGSERYGLVASSAAERLKPHAVDVRVEVDPVKWFLHEKIDTRSSFYLEDAATEFVVQGLELDWVCVAWDADLRYRDGRWHHHRFRSSRWENIKKADRQQYLKNAYRVLLTRARQGMAICVPEGSLLDPTRSPAFYDETFDYLKGLGLSTL